ncbi:MAG TPA: hypothetical protein VN843_17415 [Anaerolineales bacterium]|nr:hypothetical protein [Anaerolineales bacterium]
MNSQSNYLEKPTLVNVIAWMTLASGVINLVWGVAASGAVLSTVVGVVCVPFTILPTILGVFELIYAAKLLSNPAQPVQPSTYIAVFEIACVLTGNVFAMIVGILALVFYNDIVVREYFARLNGLLPGGGGMPAPVTPVAPPPPPIVPEPPVREVEEPLVPEPPAPPVDESVTPPSEETPSKPKRIRKIAKE